MSRLARNSFMDRARLLAWIGDRVVVGLLSDWKTSLAAERFVRNHIDGIGEDRTLNHAYRVLGGRPEVVRRAANDLVSKDLQGRLRQVTTPSGGG